MKTLLFGLLFLGCSAAPSIRDIVPEAKPPAVAVPQHIVRFLALMHFRLFAHSIYPDHEYVFCLKVRSTPDTAYVEGIDVTDVWAASDTTVSYASCLERGYRGTAHNHLPTTQYGEACYHSMTDAAAQDASGVLVALVTCGKEQMSIVARAHPRYRELIR